MTLWGCTNCGAVMVESDNLEIGMKEKRGDGDEIVREHYVERGVCPGCGGRGVVVEDVSEGERNN